MNLQPIEHSRNMFAYLTLDGTRATLTVDGEGAFINVLDENEHTTLAFVLYADEVTTLDIVSCMGNSVTGVCLERLGFQSA